MVQPGYGDALDTPRTNLGDATYLSRAPNFADISQEASFQSPGKDGNLFQQLRNGRSNGVDIRTPRRRGPLADRQNLPPSVGGAEFTPLLKSATRESARRRGKENDALAPNTPALDRIDENDVTALPQMDTSMYTGSRNRSYMDNTLPQVESSSVASTPLALPQRRGGDKGPLNDGNQLSLREQENVIDRIEKENFGLKLKIHFLEEALRKAGPGFSEATLKENTELKVDKVTMQRELHRYKKHLTSAERDLESYRQQMLELQEKARKKYADESHRAEIAKLRETLNERDTDIEQLQRRLDQEEKDREHVEKLQDDNEDLAADLREKDRLLSERNDELDDLRDKLDEAEEKAKGSERKALAMEQGMQQQNELEEYAETIEDLKQNIRQLEDELDEMKEQVDEAVTAKAQAEADLEGLQEEMANKSVTTKGRSRQDEEKIARLQEELDKSNQEYATLEKDFAEANRNHEDVESEVVTLRQERKDLERERQDAATLIQELETELSQKADEKDLLQSRHDALTNESTSLRHDIKQLETEVQDLQDRLSEEQNHAIDAEKDLWQQQSLRNDIEQLEKEVQDLQDRLSEEQNHAMDIEKNLRQQHSSEIKRLNDETSYLKADIRETHNRHDNDREEWETKKRNLESERDRAEEKATGLQRTIDRLRQTEGSLSDKESRLQEALQSENERHKSEEGVLQRQIDDLHDSLETRQTLLTSLRTELSTVKDELRQAQTDYQAQANKVAALEDDIDILQNDVPQAVDHSEELAAARRECESLKQELRDARQRASEGLARVTESPTRLRRQLSDAEAQLEKAAIEEHRLSQEVRQLEAQIRQTASSDGHELASARRNIQEIEDQKLVLEEVLEEARAQAEDAAAEHERTLRRMKLDLDRAQRERNAAVATNSNIDKHDRHLRKTQAEMENLEHDIREQQELIDALTSSEGSLRRKLERTRSERAAYRMSAEKLQRDINQLRKCTSSPGQRSHPASDSADQAIGTVVRAAEGAEERHKKEIRGMVMQMEWMQARWEREASLRADTAYAKKFVQLQLDVANACNKAQLRELEDIRTNVLGSRKPLWLSTHSALSPSSGKPTLRSFFIMARFVARIRIAARAWGKQEIVRKRLTVANEEQKRTKRVRKLKVVRTDEMT